MRYNRYEPFRYEFARPLDMTFRIIEMNGKAVQTKEGKARLADISPTGLKMVSSLDLPVEHNTLTGEMIVTITNEPITLHGQFLWKKKFFREFVYGAKLEKNEAASEKIIKELKNHASMSMK
ncbi:PilZ domain-containing protein [Metabacillus sp. GX 13764]|uniref:PilZ domain-containing protein n=1 Tax=Metabacillus kandeliae TaxID=2900151 RepID=UPI001E5D932F|nr:PilZ domain-containing protein [Metabacillus kandeliae]MCD7036115.1 PilZ domain-containing protein [Metabacillus kandeliae]